MTNHKKKRRDTSGNALNTKKHRQMTLFGSVTSATGLSAARPRKSSSATSPNKLVSPRQAKRKHTLDSSESPDPAAVRLEPATPTNKPEEAGDRSESPMPSRTKKRRMLVVENESDEEIKSSSSKAVPVPRRRMLRRYPSITSEESPESSHKYHPVTKGETKEPVSDEDLSSEVDKTHIIKSRLRTRGKKTAFQRNLERLKRRKLGKSMSSSDSSKEESEDASEEEQPKLFKGAKPASSDAESLFGGDEGDSDDSSDFIVEDNTQAVTAQLPSEFSMRSHDDLSHQFKIIFQFFVHIAVRPTVDRRAFMDEQMKTQDYFAFPLRITRRKLLGLRDSLVASSVWRPKFRKAFDTYPTYECVPLDFASPSCDACHLGGRLSTLLGRLGGVPYDKVGFMDNVEIASNSEDDSSSGSEGSITQLKKSEFGFLEFHLGRFCARRVRVYHALSHWEYHLFDAIRSEVDDLRQVKAKRGYVRVAFVGGKQPPSDLTDADGICEWLDERGIIDQEWQKMKVMMDSAHNLELSAKKGEEGTI